MCHIVRMTQTRRQSWRVTRARANVCVCMTWGTRVIYYTSPNWHSRCICVLDVCAHWTVNKKKKLNIKYAARAEQQLDTQCDTIKINNCTARHFGPLYFARPTTNKHTQSARVSGMWCMRRKGIIWRGKSLACSATELIFIACVCACGVCVDWPFGAWCAFAPEALTALCVCGVRAECCVCRK